MNSNRAILRATAILGSSSFVSVVIGLVAAKAWAVLVGPTGLGYMGLLQSLVGLAGLLAGLGLGTGLVRAGAAAIEQGDERRLMALRRASWWLVAGSGSLVGLGMCLFREPLSWLMLGGPEYADGVVWMALALVFNLVAGVQTSTLNAYHRVGVLAQIGVLNSLLGTALTLGLVWLGGQAGIAPALTTGAALNCLISGYYLTRLPRPAARPTRQEVLREARGLMRFGVPFVASMLVGSGVQLAMPVLVLQALGTESVGYYRAALTVAVTYLGFLLTAMGQDYYPRIAAASTQPARLIELVNQQHRLVMLLAVPVMLGMLALAPYLIPLVYSARFAPTVEILEWHLIGDLFKFSSWTMAFVVLTRSGSVVYFLTELTAGLTTLGVSWAGMAWFGLSGVGIGFVITYIVYYLVIFWVVRRDIKFSWTRENVVMMTMAILACLVVRALPMINQEALRTPIALSLAGLAGLWAMYKLSQELGGLKIVSKFF